ncbi:MULTISPECIES: hypothetical protein [Pseudomonas fluorescens group]|uniref:hypothetical protein n=1 Tax=Pseudomonas fluorescens group TaxID=136843 RepID=UPI00087C0BA4|nr:MULTISPECIES: hypothetical protein [Pseudomonas fluorescens group]SDU40569.1 hypothetical protein SAMN04490196_1960 [Pseudomonas moraviensis]
MSDSNIAQLHGYRAFRAKVLKSFEVSRFQDKHWHSDYEDKPHPFLALREQVRQMREWIRDNVHPLLDETPTAEPYIRRALCIPATVPLIAEEWSAFRKFGQWFVPLRLTWPHVRSVMTQVKTFEGRSYLYDNHFKRVLGFNRFGQNVYYSPSIDASLRCLEPPSAPGAKDLQVMDPQWIQVAHHFGLYKVAEVLPYAHYGHRRLEGELAWILVREKIVTSAEEFDWLVYKESRDYQRRETNAATRHVIRRMIRLMLGYGIAREQIAGIFHHQISAFNPAYLSANLNSLKSAGVGDLNAVFEVSKSLLWRAKPGIWSCVVDEVMARTPTEIARFKRLLQSSTTPSIPLIRVLKALGATVEKLPQCQSLILAISQRTEGIVPLAEIQLLAGAPYSLSIEQIAQCTDYLHEPDKLSDYLRVLLQYGYGNALGVMAFQVCYKGTRPTELDRWLGVLDSRGKDQSLEAVAEWIRQALQGGNSDAYQYLSQSVGLPDFWHMQRAEPIVKFGRGILSFLVQQKGLTSVQAIREWYFHAHGVHDLRSWGSTDATYTLLLDDAYNRNNFSFVENNNACISSAIRERTVQQLGRRPYPADDAAQAAYDQSYATLNATEHSALLPILPMILAETGGILLSSVLRHAWEPPLVLRNQLAALTPLIDELLAGGGPSCTQLGEMEADAVAMLYRTTTNSVSCTWPEVYGCQSHLSALVLRQNYVMEWVSAIRELKAPLERSSLLALEHAKLYADKFSPYRSEHIFDACKYLRAKRLKQSASDPWSLAAHLGVLFAAAHRDSLAGQWIAQDLETIVHMPQEGPDVVERLEQLDKMFSSTLPDALDCHVDTFVRRFSETDAAFLATRLIGEVDLPPDSSGHVQLREALRQTQKIVLEVCQRWVMRERKKFSKGKSAKMATQLNAILSKHPASFFAKHAADLCTRNNTKMWNEPRHAHLVVFDPKQRRLVGMALVYFEPIAALHPTRNCLIIRAINPMDDMLATHSTASIVDAFFDVAIQVAYDNGLAAVAFPAHCGAHLLSNLRPVEKDIEKRYIKPSVTPLYRRSDETVTENPTEWRSKPREVRGEFYAYERGQMQVNTLYAIWPGNWDA